MCIQPVYKCNIQNFKRQFSKDTVLYHHEVKTKKQKKKVSNFKKKHETEAVRITVYGHQIMLHPQEKENQTLELIEDMETFVIVKDHHTSFLLLLLRKDYTCAQTYMKKIYQKILLNLLMSLSLLSVS
jgi:isocitrate dehydrogenase kinase/phosphatase